MGLLLGAFLVSAVLVLSIERSSWHIFLQLHSIVIVLGGTVAILFLATPFRSIRYLTEFVTILIRKDEGLAKHIDELKEISANGPTATRSKHELISYAQSLWEAGVDRNLFAVLLSQKLGEIELRMDNAVHSLKNLSKYPPALGMLGTVMGMVTLFANLDSQKDKLGVSLSIAMTATFYGLVLANGVIQPLADRLHVKRVETHRSLTSIYEVLLLINRKEPIALIHGELDERIAS